MRRKRFWITLALAALCGLAAAWLSLDYIRSQVRPVLAATPSSTRKVAVAARSLPLGTVIRAEDVRLMSWPDGELPEGYFSSADEIAGRGLMSSMAMNEPFLRPRLADKGTGGGLPIVIREGMRAVSVRVDEVIAVAGFVVPGTRVDVLVTIAPSGAGQSKVSRVVLQNVEVVAAGQSVTRDAEGKPMTVTVITLLVTPPQAEVLTLAATEGRIQLALRGMLDVDRVATPGIRVASLVNGSLWPSGPAVAGSGRQGPVGVEMYQGGVRTLKTF